MIKYSLKCKKCENIFDSWFSSSNEYDRLKKLKLLNCEKCKSLKVEKSLMSPQVINNQKNIFNEADNKKIKLFKKKLKEYQNFIKTNFDYVGSNFAYEARSIHFNKKKSRGIYGKASAEDVKNLRDEGIETNTIPWIEDKEN